MSERQKTLSSLGAQVAVGTGSGFVAGGPLGAAIGAASPVASSLLGWGLREFAGRLLSRDEEERVATALEAAYERIAARLEAGELPRDDSFLADVEDRTDGKRLLDGVVTTAQRDYEDRKARYYGEIFANVCFESALDPVSANRYLRIGAELSYTQLQLLALVARHGEVPLPDVEEPGGSASWATNAIWHELSLLGFGELELVAREREYGPDVLISEDNPLQRSASAMTKLSPVAQCPARMVLTFHGQVLHSLMGLGSLPREEQYAVGRRLWEHSGIDPPSDYPTTVSH